MEMIGLTVVSALPVLLLVTVLGIVLAKTPLSRPAHVKRFALSWVICVLAALAGNYLTLHMGPAYGVGLTAFTLFGAIILQFHWNARRFLDLKWSRWWFLLTVTGVGGIGIAVITFFFATRSADVTPERQENPS